MYEQNAISAGNPNTIAAFCATCNVEEKHVIEYLGHLNDINIRKDIRTREDKEKRRLEGELTYKDYQWGTLTENGKVEKLKVKQLDLYLKEHGVTTVGLKLDKIKAIRFHYYRQKSPGNGNKLSSSEEEREESDTESDDDENSEDDLVIADLDEQWTVRMPVLTSVPDDQIAEFTVQAHTIWKEKKENKKKTNKKTNKNKNEKSEQSYKGWSITLQIKMEKGTGTVADPSPSKPNSTAKYDMLIGTSWTAIWHSKKVTLQLSSSGDC